MLRRTLSVGLFAVLLASTSARAATYTMADLKALAQQESWEELYEHLEDVGPAQRNDEWKALGEKAIINLLGAIKIEPNYGFEHVIGILDGVQKRYPTIAKTKGFLNKRMEVGIEAFKKTYSNYRHSGYDDPWLMAIKKFVEADQVTPELPLRAAKMVSNLLIESTTVPLYVEAVKRQKDVACKDPALHAMVVEVAADEDHVWGTEIASLVDDKCPAELRPALTKSLDTVKPEEKVEICRVLKVKGPVPAACPK